MAHPQLPDPAPTNIGRLRRWRRLLKATAMTLTAAGIVAAIGISVTALHMRAAAVPSPDPTPPLSVAATALEFESSYEIEERYLGRLEAARETALAFERGGLVLEVLVEEGESVARGQVIARLDTALLGAERAGLVAQVREAQAQLTLAHLTSERQEELSGMGYASDQKFDEARLDAEATSARIDVISARIDALDIDIAKSAITAPFSGTIAARLIDEGAIVVAGTAIVDLLETGRMQARIGLPPRTMEALREGETYELTINGAAKNATLFAVRPDLQSATRTIEAVFDVDDSASLPVGEVAELRLLRRIEGEGVWLPLSALKESANGLWTVMTAEPGIDGLQAAQEAVEILHLADAQVFVRGTLQPGSFIITEGTNRIVTGQAIALAEVR